MKHLCLPLIASAALLTCASAGAQTIERIKLSDNDLTCQQIFSEIGMMDTIIASQTNQPAPAAQAPAAAQQPGVAQGVAGAVAQQALGQVAARSGGFGSMFGGSSGGGLGGMFGSIVGQAVQGGAQQQQQAAAPAAAPAPAQNQQLIAQAQGRKEHLTGLFLGKSCKMSEVQR